MGKIDPRITILIFAFVASVYLLTAKGRTEVSDSVYSLRTVQSIVSGSGLSIDATPREYIWVRLDSGGRAYSKYGIGLPALWLPYGLIASLASRITGAAFMPIIDLLVSFNGILFGAGSASIVFLAARLLGSSVRRSAAIAISFALATACWSHSLLDFSESIQMFFMASAAYFAMRPTRGGVLAASLSFGGLILIKIFNAVYLPAFAAYIFFKSRRQPAEGLRRAASLFIFPAAAAVAILALNWLRFGDLFETGYGAEALDFTLKDIGARLWYLLFSLQDGLFVFSPALILGLLGLPALFRKAPAEAALFAAVFAVGTALYAMWHAPSYRYLVPVTPLLMLPACKLLDGRRFVRAFAAAAIAASFVLQAAIVVQHRGEYMYGVLQSVDKETASKMPPKMPGMMVVAKHKAVGLGNSYRLSEFGVEPEGALRVPAYYNEGPDFWYVYLAEKFKEPAFYFVPLLILPFAVFLARRLILAANITSGEAA